VASGEIRVLHVSAEVVLDDMFIGPTKQDSPFQQNLPLIVVDESRIFYTW